MRITVFTPTYNREYTIDKLYHSLQQQTFRDFEWVVVDDGSQDETEKLFLQYQNEENIFPVHYVKTENGGKHRAINRGVKVAQGELFFIVDSDDWLTKDALQIVDMMERSIPNELKKSFAGVCGQCGYTENKEIGKTFDGDILDITTLERVQNGISGDKAEVFYTRLLREYPFPEFDGEKFVTECVIWDKIAYDGYKLRFFNQIIYIGNYLPDGLTANYDRLYAENPRSYGLYIYQCIQYGKIEKNQIYTTYKDYMRRQKGKLTLKQMAEYLHTDVVSLLKSSLTITDVRYFPNRVLYKILGSETYEKVKRRLGR